MNDVKIIGAGMWRTGTVSLRAALEQLTGKPCHHMTEVVAHPATAPLWLRTAATGHADWPKLLGGYNACLDWPSMAFWEELSDFYPDAKVLLSIRDPEEWWHSISQTVLISAPTRQTARTPWELLVVELFEKKFIGRNPSREAAIAAYEQHNAAVRARIPAERLIEWTPADGWEPLCRALDVPVPTEDFPHLNIAADYRRKNRLPDL
ncbi:MAG TPA: sulfotransferase [Candidatus Saccharimonadales bacterium]|nr:sulfotransferase [Candidatus Saccharimonadales bacterium]